MIVINKENYEIIMFDLLEGNIKEPLKSNLIEQINDDEFYKHEWNLFQQTILIPDLNETYSGKEALIKPIGLSKQFKIYISVSIAATLILISMFLMKIERTDKNMFANIKSENIELNRNGIVKQRTKQTKIENKEILVSKPSNQLKTEIKTIEQTAKVDTLSQTIKIFDEIIIKSLTAEKIGYNTTKEESVKELKNLSIEKYPIKTKKVREYILANTFKFNKLLKDLPNVKISLNPKIKNHRPAVDITIKGETIYANALIELK
ncbi:MAG: hypothetical protein IT243_09800 [Bacteroidia bacterium]|nr:hypothetical protein [Bacteroidia bacterium]